MRTTSARDGAGAATIIQAIYARHPELGSTEFRDLLKSLQARRPGFECPVCASDKKGKAGFVEVSATTLVSGSSAECDSCGTSFRLGSDTETIAAVGVVKEWVPKLREKEEEVEAARNIYRP